MCFAWSWNILSKFWRGTLVAACSRVSPNARYKRALRVRPPEIRGWLVTAQVTTGGGIEEDLMKCLAPHKMGDFALRGADLRPKGLNRIGNLLVPNDTRFRRAERPSTNRRWIVRGDESRRRRGARRGYFVERNPRRRRICGYSAETRDYSRPAR